jgi:drug/metabolite transporter (DMT)-like permease
MGKYLVALLSIMLGAFAQLFFKKGINRLDIKEYNHIFLKFMTEWHILTGILCYGFSLLLWFYVLSQLPLSKAYPLVSIGYVISIFLGYYLLNEQITIFKFIGVVLISLGVLFISLSK